MNPPLDFWPAIAAAVTAGSVVNALNWWLWRRRRNAAAQRRLVEFVVWEMRHGDLPLDVREAAAACVGLVPRPSPPRRLTADGSLLISAFPRDETLPLVDARGVFAHEAGPIVEEFLRDNPAYILVSVELPDDDN